MSDTGRVQVVCIHHVSTSSLTAHYHMTKEVRHLGKDSRDLVHVDKVRDLMTPVLLSPVSHRLCQEVGLLNDGGAGDVPLLVSAAHALELGAIIVS